MDALRQMFAAERRWVLNLITEVLLYAGIRDGQIDPGHIPGLDGSHSHTMAINALTDVDTATTPPVVGNTLMWDGANWVPGESATALIYAELLDSDGDNLIDSDGAYLVEAL